MWDFNYDYFKVLEIDKFYYIYLSYKFKNITSSNYICSSILLNFCSSF